MDNKLYVVGGMNAMYQPRPDAWVFDPATETWSNMGGTLPPARSFHGAAAVGDKIVIFGGIVSGGSPSSDTWVYDTVASSWTQGEDFPDLGYAESVASHDGKVMVIGHTEGVIHEYDVATDTWTSVLATGAGDPGVPEPRVLAVTTQTEDTAWVIGGEDVMTAAPLGKVWSLDLDSNTWTSHEDIDPLKHSGAAVLGDDGVLDPARLKMGAQRLGESPVQILIFSGLDENGQINENQIIYELGGPQPTPIPALSPLGFIAMVLAVLLLGAKRICRISC